MRSKLSKCLAGLGATALALGVSTPAYAHRFAERYDLPVPLGLYLTGAAAAVALSFVVMALFVRATPGLHGYPRVNLLRWRAAHVLTHPYTLFVCRLLSVGVFVLVIVAGFLGSQEPMENLIPTVVWVIWWVGLAYVCALVGDLWALINPWKVIFAWMEALYRRFNPKGELSFRVPYPAWLGVWPAVILFLAFAWMELVWPHGEVPAELAFVAVVYSLITWSGMLVFGREQWLRGGEAFSVVFALLARFAPTEVRVLNPAICAPCSSVHCRQGDGECVNCYECFGRAEGADREWNLRPHAVGFLTSGPVHFSMMVFVLLILSTVTFDGLKETDLHVRVVDSVFYLPGARSFLPALARMAGDVVAAIVTLTLLAFAILVLTVYMVFSQLVAFATAASGRLPRKRETRFLARRREPSSRRTHSHLSPSPDPDWAQDRRIPTQELARLFILSLMPIAIAYHLAHYLPYFLMYGQLIVPLASDPFGFGWDLLGTAGYQINIGIIGARFAWYTAVIAIVVGHIVAVYLAHVMALRAFGENRVALRSQYPMVVLMVGYTTVSLWILAQPIVTSSPAL